MAKKQSVDIIGEIIAKATLIHKGYVTKSKIHSVLYNIKNESISVFSSESLHDLIKLDIDKLGKPFNIHFIISDHPVFN